MRSEKAAGASGLYDPHGRIGRRTQASQSAGSTARGARSNDQQPHKTRLQPQPPCDASAGNGKLRPTPEPIDRKASRPSSYHQQYATDDRYNGHSQRAANEV